MKESYTIIAYGDSLTKGHMTVWPEKRAFPNLSDVEYVPYTGFLEKLIDHYLTQKESPFSVSVANMSEDGLYVGERGLYRDDLEIPIHMVLNKKPDACIVLAGTNNLGKFPNLSVPVEDLVVQNYLQYVAESLFSLYGVLKDNRIEPISVTVPPIGIPPYASDNAKSSYQTYRDFLFGIRNSLNRRIQQHSLEHKISCVDLFSATVTKEGWMNPEYCNDGLHFNPAGYEFMAQVIFKQGVKPLLDRWMGQLVA